MGAMGRTAEAQIARFAEHHHGIFSRGHAAIVGMSRQQIGERLRAGVWSSVLHGSYRLTGAPETWKGWLLAACWAGGFRAVASHRSAAALYELAGGREDVAEITCPRWRRARHPQVEVHETKALGSLDVTVLEGIPVTTPERTLFDLGSVCSPLVVRMAFDKARRVGLVTYESTEAALRRLARPGRPGVRTLRAVLASRDPAQAPPESEMETLMLDVIERHGLPAPVPQFEVYDDTGRFVARADAAYPEARVAIEYQSYQEHAGPEPLVRDSRRRKRLRAIDWEVVDATAPELRDGGGLFCAALRAALRRSIAA
jgi:hypothetical protein